jgi:hypothetical protein
MFHLLAFTFWASDNAPMRYLLTVFLFVIAAHALSLPTPVKIRGENWKISYTNKKKMQEMSGEPDFLALTRCAQHEIFILNNQEERDTFTLLTHELFHAIACDKGGDSVYNNVSPTNRTHPGIYFAGVEWADFLLRNPDFVRFIIATQQRVHDTTLIAPQVLPSALPPRSAYESRLLRGSLGCLSACLAQEKLSPQLRNSAQSPEKESKSVQRVPISATMAISAGWRALYRNRMGSPKGEISVPLRLVLVW